MFPRPRVFAEQAGLWGVSLPLIAWLIRHVRNYDAVHLHYVWSLSTIVGAALGRLTGRRVVLTAHESLTSYDIETASGSRAKRNAKLLVRSLIMRCVGTVVCASELERRDSLRSNEIGVVISHPVVESPRATPLPTSVGSDLTIGYLGRLHPKKNIDVLLRALALTPDARLIVCGDGDTAYRDQVQTLATDLGIEDRVDWRGHVDVSGKEQLFAEADVTVMASAYECFGMAGAEAMASGRPVVVTETTGLAPIIRKFDAGAVVAQGDEVALARVLASLATGDLCTKELGERALAASTATFTFAAYGSAIELVYRGLPSPEAGATWRAAPRVPSPR